MPRRSIFDGPAAEAWAVGKGAPARGSGVPIDSKTRHLVRRWAVACGIRSDLSYAINVAELSEAWHDRSNATIERLLQRAAGKTPAPATPATPTPAPIPTPEEKPKMNLFNQPNPPAPTPARDNSHEAKLRAIADLFATPAMDEEQVLDIMRRNLGTAIAGSIADIQDKTRLELENVVEEARAIVNGAPRTLRIEIKGRIRDLPPAPRHPLFDTMLAMVVVSRHAAGLPVMLVGPAASGKTTACKQAADAMGLPFFTNGALTGAHELTGYKDGAGQYHTTPFRQAFEHGGIYLMDELDRSDPAAVLALNSALANGFMAFPDRAEPVQAHPDFIPLVAANTYGRGADRVYVGANQLDGATLDRFAVLSWDYDEALERALAGDDAWTSYVQAARKAASELKVRHLITPRASIGGAALRRAGLAFDAVTDAVIWKGLDMDQRTRITNAIPESVARRAQAPVIMLAAE